MIIIGDNYTESEHVSEVTEVMILLQNQYWMLIVMVYHNNTKVRRQ